MAGTGAFTLCRAGRKTERRNRSDSSVESEDNDLLSREGIYEGDGNEESARAGSERVGRPARAGACQGDGRVARPAPRGPGSCQWPRRLGRLSDLRRYRSRGSGIRRVQARGSPAMPEPNPPVGDLPAAALQWLRLMQFVSFVWFVPAVPRLRRLLQG